MPGRNLYSASHTGKTKVPGLSAGNVNRNLSIVKSLHDSAFQRLVELEGWSLDRLCGEFTRLSGCDISKEEAYTRWTGGSLACLAKGHTWKSGRRRLDSLLAARNIYPTVFTRKQISKSNKISKTIPAQSEEVQLAMIEFFWRGLIINGIALLAEKPVPNVFPACVFGDIVNQDDEDQNYVAWDINKTVIPELTTAYEELGRLDPGYKRTNIGTLEEIIQAAWTVHAPHWSDKLTDPRGFKRRRAAKDKL